MQIEIIMVTYNNFELTKKAIVSIQRFTHVEHKLIIVDNASESQMQEWLRQQALHVNFQKENIGVAKARNVGIRQLSEDCEFVLFIDNDIEITQDDWLPKLLAACIEKDVAAVGPCSDYVSGLQTCNLRTSKQYLHVPFLITFCMLVRRNVVDEIGNFDGFEAHWGNTDIDYSVRMRQAGYKLINARDVFVKHAGFETRRRQDELVTLKEKFIVKWDQETFNNLYNFDKWMALPENREDRQITIIGIDDAEKKREIEAKLDHLGLGVQTASFQNQVPSLDNSPIVLPELDQQVYESKLDRDKKLVLWELPATCNLNCPICYVKNRKTTNQDHGPKHFSNWLYKVDSNAHWIVWLCSEGEPAFYPGYDKIIDHLIECGYTLATTTNLTQDTISNLHSKAFDSLGILWSVHYTELKRKGLLDSTFKQARILDDKGATIAPLVVATKSHLKQFDEINDKFCEIGLNPTLRHERIFPQGKPWYHRELTELWELNAIEKARKWGWSFVNWNYEHFRFHVKGGSCSAGTHFLAVLTDWTTISCGGCGQKLGVFPKVPKEYTQGICKANLCPCPTPHELGCNSKVLTPTLAETYGYNHKTSRFSKEVDIYMLNGLRRYYEKISYS